MTAVLIVIRVCRVDQQEHAYRAVQLAEPLWQHLVPVCGEWPYPLRHPRNMIGLDDLRAFGNMLARCPGCAVWMRRNSYEVVVRGEVFP
jgi:hypothetical protein